MLIKHQYPPNYDEIKEYFPEADYESGTLFTYDGVCYCKEITPDLIAHEEVHVKQQMEMGVKEWWQKYFVDSSFRLSQEIEAYRAQWQWIEVNIKDRNAKDRFFRHIVNALSGPLYGNLVSYSEAVKLIRK